MGICENVSQKKVASDQLCCWYPNKDGICTTDNISDCYAGHPDEEKAKWGILTKCYTIKNIDACNLRGNEEPARSVCDKKDSLYCLGAAGLAILTKDLFPELHPAYKWAINNRTFYINSLSGAKACYDETKREFNWCGSNPDLLNTTQGITMECKDFFQASVPDCTMRGSIISPFNFTILKKICKDPNWMPETTSNPTVTTSLVPTSTENSDNGLSNSDKIALGTSLGVGLPTLILATLAWLFAPEQSKRFLKRFFSVLFCCMFFQKICKKTPAAEGGTSTEETEGMKSDELSPVNFASNTTIVTDASGNAGNEQVEQSVQSNL